MIKVFLLLGLTNTEMVHMDYKIEMSSMETCLEVHKTMALTIKEELIKYHGVNPGHVTSECIQEYQH